MAEITEKNSADAKAITVDDQECRLLMLRHLHTLRGRGNLVRSCFLTRTNVFPAVTNTATTNPCTRDGSDAFGDCSTLGL